MTRRPLVAEWRNTVRESGLDRTAKLVAFVLSTYMSGEGVAWPSKDTIAAGASLVPRAVDAAIDRLEAFGLLDVERSKGRKANRYRARDAGLTVQGGRGSTPHLMQPTPHERPSNPARAAPESAESAESVPSKKRNGRAPKARQDLAYLDRGIVG